MEVLIILGIIFLIYRVAFEVPKDIKNLEIKIDTLKLHLQEIEIKLTDLDKKIDKIWIYVNNVDTFFRTNYAIPLAISSHFCGVI